MTVTLFQALSRSSKGWLAVPGADFLLPGLVGTGWGRAGLQEAGWFVYSQSITTPEPKERGALQPGEQCWHQLYEPLFLFLFADWEQFLKPTFSNSLRPSASVPACCLPPLKTLNAGAALTPPPAAGLLVSKTVGSVAGKSLFNQRQAVLCGGFPKEAQKMLPPG